MIIASNITLNMTKLSKVDINWMLNNIIIQHEKECTALKFGAAMPEALFNKIISIRVISYGANSIYSYLLFDSFVNKKNTMSLMYNLRIKETNVEVLDLTPFLIFSNSKCKMEFINFILGMKTKSVQISINNLKERLGITGKYDRIYDLEKYILNPLLDDLKLYSQLSVVIERGPGEYLNLLKEKIKQKQKQIIYKKEFTFINLNHALSELSNILISNEVPYDVLYKIARSVSLGENSILIKHNDNDIAINIQGNKVQISEYRLVEESLS